MSSENKDEISKKAAEELYKAIHQNLENAPDYVKSMSYALKVKDEDLVKSLLHHGEKFYSKEVVTNLLADYLKKHHSGKLEAGLDKVMKMLTENATKKENWSASRGPGAQTTSKQR